MTISELFKTTTEAFPELEVFQEVIEVPEGETIKLPYLYFYTGETAALGADNITYWSTTPVTLALVESEPSEELGDRVVEFLNDNRLPFTEATTWNDEVGAYLHEFYFEI